MKNLRVRKYLILIVLILLTITINSNVYGIELKEKKLSKRYQEWLELPEEEKENTYAPLPFNVRGKKVKGIARLRSIAKAVNLPAKYDLRDYIDIEIKNQMETGQCWAFSANSSVETTLAKQGETLNFSERHLEFSTASNYIDGENEYALNRKIDDGGYNVTAYTYYTRGSGPVLEEDMPFENNTNEIKVYELPINNAIKKVDNIIYFPSIYKEKDEENNIKYVDGDYEEYTEAEVLEIRNQIKEHIMTYGAVSIFIDSPNFLEISSNKNSKYTNHVVTVVGWDDNYSKENFEIEPNNDGAYIVLNSWGEEFGDNGYYYISYEDSLVEVAVIGEKGISDIKYDNLYQYDISEMWNALEYKYAANVFDAKGDETLEEIMIGATDDQTCNIYLSDSRLDLGNATLIASDVKLHPGFTTISLENEIELNMEDSFAIVVEITSEEIYGVGIEDNGRGFSNAKSNPNESFVSDDGVNWEDIYDENDMKNLSIKAYSKSKEKFVEVTDIKGKAYETYGGKFSFSINTNYTEKGNVADIKIYKDNIDVTDQFIISGNKIRGNGAFVTIQCNNGIESGEYVAKIKLSDFEEIEKGFKVDNIDSNIEVIQFNNEDFFKFMIKKLNCIANADDLVIVTTKEEVNKITELDMQYEYIQDFTGIEKFTEITHLDIPGCGISDLSDISRLNKLEYLNLSGNYLEDISQLENCTNLKYLNISYNDHITDISVLGRLRNLVDLEMQNLNSVTDYSVLNNMNNLELLSIGGQYGYLDNLDFLDNKTKLQTLIINSVNKETVDMNKITSLYNLVSLDLQWNEWITEVDLKDLNRLENLKSFSVTGTNIKNIEFLRGIELEHLELNWGDVCDLEPISEMYTLKSLYLQGLNRLTTLDDIKNLYNLEELSVSGYNLLDASSMDDGMINIDTDNPSNYLNLRSNLNIKIKDKNEVIEIPNILKQMMDENSKIYVGNDIEMYGFHWEEYGKTIKIDDDNNNEYYLGSIILGDSGLRSEEDTENRLIYFCGDILLEEETAKLLDVEMTKSPKKLEYYEGEEFDDFGLVLIGTYSDEYNDEIKERFIDYEISPKGALKSEDTEVVISYELNGETKEIRIPITVKRRELTDIAIRELPVKLEYFEGEMLDITGLEVYAIYDDESIIDILEYEVIPEGPLTVEDTKVTIRYTEGEIAKEAEYDITVQKIELELIEITKAPNKIEYIEGESFNPEGMEVIAYYNNGESAVIENYELIPEGALTVEDNKITVRYTEGEITKETTIEIIVHEKEIEKMLDRIEITKAPNKVEYVEGETFDPDGMEVYAIYSDESKVAITDYEIIVSNPLTLEDDVVTIIYEDKEANLPISVYKKDNPDVGELVTIQFKDEKFFNDVIEQLGNKVKSSDVNNLTIRMLPSDRDSVTSLSVYPIGLGSYTDITGIENFTNLETLRITGVSTITDISPIANLKKLKTLELTGSKVEDISPIAELTNLTELELYDNQIKDITPIAGLTNLTKLSLQKNQISDISPLSNLNKLTILKMWNNQIKDMSVISRLTNLTELWLGNNKISDISPLRSLDLRKMYFLSK